MVKIKQGYYLRPEYEFPFCPGCGHTNILTSLDQAMGKLKLDPLKTVIVTDIGCIGLSDRFFNVNAFHGLHGRALTYASGIKMANPELTVITLMGDGGLGIGGTHFINAAKRNIDITLIVANNFNFGMTGGEHSVTTPLGGITSSTFLGNIEQPLDACEIVKAVKGGFAARATVFDKNIVDLIAEAISFKGFALVDIWEYCTAYYVPRNKFNKAAMLKILEDYGFKTGIIYKNERTEFTENYNKTYVAAAKKILKQKNLLSVLFPNQIQKLTGIVLAGSAGQKIKSSTTILGNAAIMSGLYATQKDDYPITVMTGHSVSELLVDKKTINYTEITNPEYLIIIGPEGLQKVEHFIPKMTKDKLIMIDTLLKDKLPKTEANVVSLPFEKTAFSVDKGSIAIVALASFLEYTKIFPTEALRKAVEFTQKSEIAELNLKAIEMGVNLCKL